MYLSFWEMKCKVNRSLIVNPNHSDEGLTLETSAFYPLWWLIYVFNPVVNTKLPAKLTSQLDIK